MRKLSILTLLLITAITLNFSATKVNAQTDAQYLNGMVADKKPSLPTSIGSFVFEDVYSICPVGCQTSYSSKFLAFNAYTPNILRQNVTNKQLSDALIPLMLSDYCQSATPSRNMGIVIYLFDRNRTPMGEVYVNATNCPRNTVVTTVPTVTNPVAINPGNSGVDEVEVSYTNVYRQVWNDQGSGAMQSVSFWRPEPAAGWARVGHHAKQGYGNPTDYTMVVRARTAYALANPIDYLPVWNDAGSGANQDGSVWRPICPNNYASLGDVASGNHFKPRTDEVTCVSRSALVAALPGLAIWNDTGSGANFNFGAWSIVPPSADFQFDYASCGLFYSVPSHNRPAVNSVGGIWAVRTSRSQNTGNTPTNASGGTVEDQYWNAVVNSTRIQDFQSYLNNYPNGKYTPLAQLKINQLSGNSIGASSNVEQQYWDTIKNSQNSQDYQGYVNNYPNGQYSALARLRISQLQGTNTASTSGNPLFSQPLIPVATGNQTRGNAILAKAQIGNLGEILRLTKYWIITEPGDLDSKAIISDELRDDYPKLTAALREEDADFFVAFAMVDQSTGRAIIGNSSAPNQTQIGEVLVFTSIPSSSGIPNIRILFRTKKTRVFNQQGGTFNRHPATNATREFTKQLKKINF